MEKRRYYVSVQAKTVMANQGDSAYEFEIDATPDEVRQLYELFEAESEADLEQYYRVHSPETIVDGQIGEDFADRHLTEIYRLIERLGTPETKAHIRSMNVLDGIQYKHGQS